MIITQTIKVGGKGYKSGVSQAGKAWQLQSFKAFPFEEYVSVSLPDFIREGMIVTVSGTVKRVENNQYKNYNLQYPIFDVLYHQDSNAAETPESGASYPAGDASSFANTSDPFYAGSPLDISEDDMPF